jgi:anti-sigma B factor antagonist
VSDTRHAAAQHPFGVELTQTHDSAWVHLVGELDLATAAEAEAAIASATTRGKRVTVDLRGLDFIDSTGISLLVRCNRRAEEPLAIVARAGPNTRLLELCGLDHVLALLDNPETEGSPGADGYPDRRRASRRRSARRRTATST